MNTTSAPVSSHSIVGGLRAPRAAVQNGMLLLCAVTGLGFSAIANAQEDPDVARARAEAHRQYEAKKAAEKRQAIALTKQGVVALYNANAGAINYNARWLLWDGSYTNWTPSKLEGKKSTYYWKAGGIKLQVKFSSAGGGEKNYALESAQVPSDIKASAADAQPNHFVWGANNALDLFKGKPKNW